MTNTNRPGTRKVERWVVKFTLKAQQSARANLRNLCSICFYLKNMCLVPNCVGFYEFTS